MVLRKKTEVGLMKTRKSEDSYVPCSCSVIRSLKYLNHKFELCFWRKRLIKYVKNGLVLNFVGKSNAEKITLVYIKKTYFLSPFVSSNEYFLAIVPFVLLCHNAYMMSSMIMIR